MFFGFLRIIVCAVVFIGQSSAMLSRRQSAFTASLPTISEHEFPLLPASVILPEGPDAEGNFKSTQALYDYVKTHPSFCGSGSILGRALTYVVTKGKYASDICIRA